MSKKIYSKKETYIIKHWFDDIKSVATELDKSKKWVKKRAIKIATEFNNSKRAGRGVNFTFTEFMEVVHNWNIKNTALEISKNRTNGGTISLYKKRLANRVAATLENHICDILDVPVVYIKNRHNEIEEKKKTAAKLRKTRQKRKHTNTLLKKISKYVGVKKNWTEKDELVLINYYNHKFTYLEMAIALKTTTNSIDSRLQKLRKSGIIELTRKKK